MIQSAPLCAFEGAQYLIFSPNIPEFVYYSHIPVFIAALLMALFIIVRSRHHLPSSILFWTIIPFLLWVFFDSIFWASNQSATIMFVWSAIILIEPLIHAGIFYLQYLLTYKKPLAFRYVALLSLLFAPLIIFVPTTLTLSAFDLESCLAVEGILGLYYSYFVEAIFIILIIITGIRGYITATTEEGKQKITYLSAGILFFLLLFTAGNLFGSFTTNWQIGQLGLLGMPIFLGILMYTIVRFQAFKRKVLASQALVVVLWLLLFGTLFTQSPADARIIIGSTLILFTVLGFILIRSVKKGEAQRKEIERLAEKLKRANKHLRELDQLKSEFVSIASHQLRSPLTSIRGYTSMMLEGSYGKIPKKAQEPLEHIHESSRYMVLSIEDFLNVSRIESGKMKYSYSKFNLKDLAEDVVDETRNVALKKGLLLTFRTKCRTGCTVRADIGKIRQVLHNLIDNSIKYTPKGTITVIAHDNARKKKMYVSIQDTGIGMNKETLGNIFAKFVRAKNANSVNVTGSGLGLYVAKQMVEEMGGTITAASEGAKKGSTFTLELPLIPKKK